VRKRLNFDRCAWNNLVTQQNSFSEFSLSELKKNIELYVRYYNEGMDPRGGRKLKARIVADLEFIGWRWDDVVLSSRN
jgi:hypothetical protein